MPLSPLHETPREEEFALWGPGDLADLLPVDFAAFSHHEPDLRLDVLDIGMYYRPARDVVHENLVERALQHLEFVDPIAEIKEVSEVLSMHKVADGGPKMVRDATRDALERGEFAAACAVCGGDRCVSDVVANERHCTVVERRHED